ncbi:MAG: putative membrane protein YecN with MAPEG domain [Pseudohongiellaceae bacterium]|jgi:uncharacterized membrane protein YecN with MAPEG domain
MNTVTLSISSLYIALLALLIVSLAFRVVMMRLRYKVGMGDGKHPPLQLAIRTHANAVEYIPIALLLLAALENTWQINGLTHAMGSTLFLGRVLHVIGLSQNPGSSKPRFIGTLLTWIMIVVSSFAVLAYSVLHSL